MKSEATGIAFVAAALLAAGAVSAGQTFTMDEKAFVPFDASTTVSVDCPDPTAAK